MLKTKVDASGFYARLDKLNEKLNSIPWAEASTIVQASVMANFEVGGRYKAKGEEMGGSQKWEPRKDNLSHKILKKSGKLQSSIYGEVHADGFAIGSKLEYQAVHNFGYPKRNIAARPFLVVQQDDLNKIEELIISHLGV